MATPGKTSDTAVKFLTSTTGRDKVNRFVQYVCKFLIGYGGTRLSKESLGKLSALMVQATQTRKVMRLGRQLEFYKAAQKARLIQDDVLRYTGIVKNAGLGLWLVYDSLSWAHGAGIIKLSNVKDINRRGYQFWWLSIVASLLSDLHRLRMNGIRRQLEQKTLVASNKNKVFQDASVAQQSLTQLEKWVFLHVMYICRLNLS
jgi:peroxin-11B